MAIKFPKWLSLSIRRVLGTAESPGLNIDQLRELAQKESVLVLGLAGIDPSLPGEQKAAFGPTLDTLVASEPKDRPIVLHCT